MKYILLFFLLLNISVFCQKAELYRQYLPEKLANQEYSESLLSGLDELIVIHPDLVYFYLESIKIRINKAEPNRTTIANSLILSAKLYYEIKRFEWQESIKEKIKDSGLPDALKNKILSHFNFDIDTAVVANNTFTDTADQNYVNFYDLIYYSGKAQGRYNKELDYTSLKTNLENTNRENLVSKISTEPYNVDNFDLVTDNWFLFTRDEDIDFVTNVLEKFFKDYYATDNQPLLSIEAGMIFIQDLKFNSPYIIQTKTSNISLDYEFGRAAINGFSVLLSYKYYFKDYIGLFNYADLQLGYLRFSMNRDEEIGNERGYVKTIHDNQRESLVFKNNRVNYKNVDGFTVRLSTPLLYFGNYFCFTAGAQVSYYSIKLNRTYNYTYAKFTPGAWGPTYQEFYNSGNTTTSEMSDYVKVTPTIGFLYNSRQDFSLRFEYFLDQYFLTAGYNLF